MFFLKTFLKYFKHFVKVLTKTSHTNIRGEQITPKRSWSLVFPLFMWRLGGNFSYEICSRESDQKF